MAGNEKVRCIKCNNIQAVSRILYEPSKITVFCIKDHPTEISCKSNMIECFTDFSVEHNPLIDK